MKRLQRFLRVTLILLLVAGACGDGAGNGGGGGDDVPKLNVHKFGTPEQIGTGLLAGMTLDGSAAYVEDLDPRFQEPGCEGQPEPVMFRIPIDGGERTLVNEQNPLRGSLVRGGSGGRVAVVAGCESFFTELLVIRESQDGAITDVTAVTPAVPEGFLLNPASFSWSRDGSALLAALQDVDAPDGDPAQVVSIDPQSGQIIKLFDAEQGTGVFRVGQLENGLYVLATNLVVSFRNAKGVIQTGFPGQNFEISPDGRRVAIYGKRLLVASQTDTEATEILAEMEGREISAVAFSPDGEALTINRYRLDGGQVEIGVATIDDRKFTSVVTGGQYGRSYFSGDGKALAFNQFGSEPDFVSKVYVTSFETS